MILRKKTTKAILYIDRIADLVNLIFFIGRLREKVIVESFMQFIMSLLNNENPQEKLKKLMENADMIFRPNLSLKHMNTMDMEFTEKKKVA